MADLSLPLRIGGFEGSCVRVTFNATDATYRTGRFLSADATGVLIEVHTIGTVPTQPHETSFYPWSSVHSLTVLEARKRPGGPGTPEK